MGFYLYVYAPNSKTIVMHSTNSYLLTAGGLVIACCLLRLIVLLKRERIKLKQQQALDQAKTNFFADISHEFRTPLSLIIGPLKRLIREDESEERKKAGFLILRHAERLQRLINQILDLNSIEAGKMPLHVQAIELVAFVSNTISMFTELARQKNISLSYTWRPDTLPVWYDPDMLDKCLNNLLYNALKFTPEGGKIQVNLNQSEGGEALLNISDTGAGMDKETAAHAFDRFFQGAHPDDSATGTGIGLHLTKSIVEMHHGHISLSSEEGKGSSFTLIIRQGNEHFSPESLQPSAQVQDPADLLSAEDEYMNELSSMSVKAPPKEKNDEPERLSLLLIEDNSDMRLYIRQELADRYHIVEAADGKTGLAKAHHLMPDLIITDLMMPEMNGATLCRTLKAEPDTCHIPIIILTAQDDFERRLECLEAGADTFIGKPFNTKYLQLSIEKLIELRHKMKERFGKPIDMDAQEVALTSMDERLLQRSIDYVRANIENTDLSVELMSKYLGLSRTHLHRKLKALTGQSPVEFIKMIRMKQAAYLLNTGKLTVSEVGYRVGYNTPSYFSSSFNSHFGMSPTAYMEKAVKGQS